MTPDDLQQAFDEIQTQLEDTNQSLSDFSDNVDQAFTDTQTTLDDHETRLGDTEEKAGQLDFPLTQDSIDRIKEVFPTGIVTLVGGTAIVNDTRIGLNSVIFFSVQSATALTQIIPGGGGTVNFPAISYTLAGGSVTFTSSNANDNSTLVYLIF